MGSILGITSGELATRVVPATLADVYEAIALLLRLRLSLSPVIGLEVTVQNASEVGPRPSHSATEPSLREQGNASTSFSEPNTTGRENIGMTVILSLMLVV